MPDLYLEDYFVGQIFRHGSVTVDAEAIKAFAREFDPQPFHTDEDAARDTFFKGLAASGWHTAALTMRLFVESGLKPVGGLVGAGVDELRWPRAVRPGDVLRVEVEVLDVRVSNSRPTHGVVKARAVTFNQNDEPVQIETTSLFVPRRPA